MLLTFVFIVIIFMVICNRLTSEMVIATTSLWFVIFWIGFDNIGVWMTSINTDFLTTTIKKCGFKKPKKRIRFENTKNTKNKISEDINIDNNSMEKKIQKTVNEALKKSMKSKVEYTGPSKPRPIPLIYSEENYKYNMFDEIGCDGDNKLAHKMKQISNKNREAMDNFSRSRTKYSNINYFEQELKDAASSHGWWDNDELEKEF
jgi:hypothetical protein